MKIISRDYIHATLYPFKKRMSKSQILQHFWDFYALELMTSLSKNDHFTYQRLTSLLSKTTTLLLSEQVKALEASVRGEIRHFINACKKMSHSNTACYVSDYLAKVYKHSSPISISLETTKALFKNKKVWDVDFGGKSWANATLTLIQAKKALQEHNMGDMIFYVDHIFDLHHNSGFILNKTNFNVLDEGFIGEPTPLEQRRNIKSLKGIKCHVKNPIILRELNALLNNKAA